MINRRQALQAIAGAAAAVVSPPAEVGSITFRPIWGPIVGAVTIEGVTMGVVFRQLAEASGFTFQIVDEAGKIICMEPK